MEQFDKKEKGTDPNLKIAIISSAVAGLTLVENILDISLPLPSKTKWVIFTVFSVIAVVFFCRILFRSSKAAPESQTSPVVQPISMNIKKYLKATENRSEVNQVRIHAGKFQLFLNTSQMCDGSGEPLIDQTVHWELEGSNIGPAPMTSFTIAISLSAYTSWRDGTISFCSRLKKKNSTQIYSISTIDWKEPSVQDREDIRFLTFKFPPGTQCIYAEAFIFELDMVWNRGAYFHDVERYFSDPCNYGVQVDKLTIEVVSDSRNILDRHFLLYHVNRVDPRLILLEPPRKTQWVPVSWTVYPEDKALYVIEIKK